MQHSNNKLSTINILSLGFMLFAFFLGAGNLIFPPNAGLTTGNNFGYATIGFLLTGVGLPVLGIIAIAISGGTLQSMVRYLPKGTGTLATIILFIVIGPAFATPRTALVTWELSVRSLLPLDTLETTLQYYQFITVLVFFIIAALFAIFPSKLIDNIGKFLTPSLLILLLLLFIGVLINPWGEIQHTTITSYSAFNHGLLEGYNTMDALAALMFGGLIVELIKKRGITHAADIKKYLVTAGIIAAIGLSCVYVSLFWLGATAGGQLPVGSSGTQILVTYIDHLFGEKGNYILAIVVALACLTTAIGLLSAGSAYFAQLTHNRISYKIWVIIFAILCIWVAEVGLVKLIKASIPTLYALYPMVITLVTLTLLKKFMKVPYVSYRLVMFVALVMGLGSAIKHFYAMNLIDGVPPSTLLGIPQTFWKSINNVFSQLPLAQHDMEWFLPVLVILIITLIIDRSSLLWHKN